MRRLLTLSVLALLSGVSGAQTASVKGADGVAVEVSAPKRVVALNATTLELIAMLGKLDTVVGRDVTGTYPKNKIPSVGHWAVLPVEGIVALKPDLVVGTADNFGMPKNAKVVDQLRKVGVKVLVLSSSNSGGIKGLKERTKILGEAYGIPNKAKEIIKNYDNKLGELKMKALSQKPKVMFLYAHNKNEGSIYGTKGGANDLIEMAGGVNVATFEDTRPISAEAIVKLNPDVIIMLDRGLEAVGGMKDALTMPGVAQTNAGKNKRIYTVDNGIRWIGPRFPEFALKLAGQWAKDLK